MHFTALDLAALEELDKEAEERLRIFDDFPVMNDSSLTEEGESEGEAAFPAFGRRGTLKTRYALEEAAVTVVMVVARRRDAMRKFMVTK